MKETVYIQHACVRQRTMIATLSASFTIKKNLFFCNLIQETGSIRVQEQSREEFADHILRPRQLNSSQQQAQSPEIEVPRSSTL